MNFRNLLLAGSLFFLAACNSEETTTTETETTNETTGSEIGLTPTPDFEEFPDARLAVGNVTAKAEGDSVRVSFDFNVSNYELKNQTDDSTKELCSNSGKGQHIHFIMDNAPYVALYEPKHEVMLPKNSEHHLLVFLSRSYHMSIKNDGASALYSFRIDENGKLEKMDNPTTPMVFYSRPKGDYLGKDTENVLFDFYVWNTNLSDNGHKVKATVKANGQEVPLTISDWRPYFLQNLPMGTQSITLTMVDKDGNKVDGPETEVTREFTLAQDEPMVQ